MSTDFLTSLNEHQLAAVTHDHGPALVLAGAGSGKTKVLTTRAAWLISQHQAQPEEILLVTFTNKAAGEMKQRIQTLTGSHLPWSGTFHSLCARILRIDGKHIGLPSSFTIFDTEDQLSLIKQIYKELNLSPKEFPPKSVRAAISEAKNELLTVSDYQDHAYGRFAEHVARLYKLYEHKLRQMEAADFDDLMLKTNELFAQIPPALAKYRQLFGHILVDEYQDTNKAQYQLTKFVTNETANIFVVGDFSQSIYAWRGADYRNMLQLKTDFPEIKEYRLERNYRSTQTILDAATFVVSQNTSHPILSLWTDKPQQDLIHLYEARDSYDEAEFVTSTIKDLRPTHQLHNMAILYRTNAQSREFEESLIKAHLPYRIVGGLKFYERKEIKDILAYLRVLANAKDEVSYHRIEGLGKRVLATYLAWKEDILSHYQLDDLEPKTILTEILATTHYSERFDAKDPEDISRLENIDELLRVASQFTSITNFLENIALIQQDYFPDQQNQSGEQNPTAITLMSLHAAKGLEFEVVFMVGMEEGLLPHARSYLDKQQLEEERRLCYVGITRAKDKLFLTYRRRYSSYQNNGGILRSRFINDIPPHLIQPEGNTIFAPKHNNNVPERQFVPLDDDTLNMVLNGEIDVETFLNSR